MMWKRRKHGPVTDEQWQQAWNNPQPLAAERKQALLNAIHQRTNTIAMQRRRVAYISAGAAAAVLVSFIVRFTWMNKELAPATAWNRVASNSDKKKILLADGSVIWLAPYAAVRVYPAFTAHRNVILEKGTAFFAVAQDKAHPFSVAINKHQVKVLGTQFTITMKDTADLLLEVKEGKVALTNSRRQVIVNGGEQVSTFNAVADTVKPVNRIMADWWLQQEVRLMDVPLGELLDNIEAYYHVKLHAAGVKRKTRVTLTWYFAQPLNQNLAVLNQLTGNNIY